MWRSGATVQDSSDFCTVSTCSSRRHAAEIPPEALSGLLVSRMDSRSGVGAATGTALKRKIRGGDEKVVNAFSRCHARCRIATESVEWVSIVGHLHAVGITDDTKLARKVGGASRRSGRREQWRPGAGPEFVF